MRVNSWKIIFLLTIFQKIEGNFFWKKKLPFPWGTPNWWLWWWTVVLDNQDRAHSPDECVALFYWPEGEEDTRPPVALGFSPELFALGSRQAEELQPQSRRAPQESDQRSLVSNFVTFSTFSLKSDKVSSNIYLFNFFFRDQTKCIFAFPGSVLPWWWLLLLLSNVV